MAAQDRARIAASGWRLPRLFRKSGTSASTSMRGRQTGSSTKGSPCLESSFSIIHVRRKLNDPECHPLVNDIREGIANLIHGLGKDGDAGSATCKVHP